MSGHPCRAHHKLKWARKGQSALVLLYSHFPRSESNKAICAANSGAHQRFAAYPNSAGSTLFDRGWQQPLDHHGAQPARRVKDAEGTAQPLVLDSVRWLGYLAIVRQRHAIVLPPKKLLLKVKPSKKRKILKQFKINLLFAWMRAKIGRCVMKEKRV